MNDRFKLMIGYLFSLGLLISLLLTASGGIYYLIKEGSALAISLIQMGILTLILTQILRVFLVGLYYWKKHDFKFVFFSFFIFGILLLSFWLR